MFFVNDSNDVKCCIALSYTYILSSTASRNSGGMRVELYDFRRIMPLFISKSLPKNNWLNDSDVFFSPRKERGIRNDTIPN